METNTCNRNENFRNLENTCIINLYIHIYKLPEEEEGRKITGYEEYTITIASEKVHVAPCKLQKGNRYAWFHKKGGQERKQTKHDSNNV